jgi:CheY-like chemotaxis protein
VQQGKRVLIVEDQRETAEMFSALVSLLGHTPCFVTNPVEALSTAKEFRPEIAFMDIGMPGLNGWEVVRLFRQDPLFRSLKIYALTAYGTDEDRRKSRDAGFDLHLIKPIAMAQLEQLLVAS